MQASLPVIRVVTGKDDLRQGECERLDQSVAGCAGLANEETGVIRGVRRGVLRGYEHRKGWCGCVSERLGQEGAPKPE